MTTLESLPPELAPLRVLDAVQASAFVGVGLDLWRKMYRRGDAPTPIPVGARKLGWQVGTLADWIESRKNATAA